ncbi:uncharacterized protein BX664DRAFT_344426 [Halteromyces radiatus]|uniref:uncharacterized protein n=1 Tax=Halteromyces radiatus TaxID=101107 RepID=UPI002220FE27|nr:uncharacterized protein BX664DRAFT_344426 [Halteromyces radiatus]KAI8076340.1 hypothetical protein BX664DRAFT_344426 [Halteromyces radiatus]
MPITRHTANKDNLSKQISNKNLNASNDISEPVNQLNKIQHNDLETRPSSKPNQNDIQLNQTLQSILNILTRHDRYNLTTLEPFKNMQQKLTKCHYLNADEFKNDIDILFTKIRLNAKTQDQRTIEQLYIALLGSIKLETTRLRNQQEGHSMMETSSLEPNDQHWIQTALFRPTIDGFMFTDANSNMDQINEPLPSRIQTIAIHPIPAETFAVPSMKQVVQLPYRFPSRFLKHEDKPIVPVQWLDYGPFSSFAPACDSNNANACYESTYMGRATKRFRRWERKHRRSHMDTKQSTDDMDIDIDVEWLQNQGLDVDAIVGATMNEDITTTMTDDDNNDENHLDNILNKNKKLIEELLIYQERRFASSSDKYPTKVDMKEQETADTLQRHFYEILSQLSPSSIIQPQDIENAMARLPLQEAAYRGSLPPNKIFAFPSSDKMESSLPPPYANITPTYAKERWRMIDVQGHDLSYRQQQQSSSSSSTVPQVTTNSHTPSPLRS